MVALLHPVAAWIFDPLAPAWSIAEMPDFASHPPHGPCSALPPWPRPDLALGGGGGPRSPCRPQIWGRETG